MKHPLNALLIGNGECPSPTLLQQLAARADFILAADGGAQKAAAAGIMPDKIIGDFDSLSTRHAWPKEKLLRIPRQDNTDLEKALDYLQDNHFTHVTIAGGTGGRWDFSIGNFLSVYPYLLQMDICFAADGWKIYPLIKPAEKIVRPGARVSLIPVTACQNVTLKGLQYPLQNARLELGHTGRTLSNCAAQEKISVQFTAGYLLLYIED